MFPVVEQLTLKRCRIDEEDGLLEIDDGLIMANGSSVSIAQWDGKRYAQVERLTKAESKSGRGKVMITGHAVSRRAGLGDGDHNLVKLIVVPGKGCTNCP